MSSGINRFTNICDRTRYAGGGLVMDNADSLDLVRGIGAKAFLYLTGIDAAAPIRCE